MRRRAGVLVAIAGLAMGCVNIGHEFPVDRVPSISIGETTRDDVRRAFGTPWRTGLEDGQRTWTYARYRYSILGAAQTRDLVVRFDEQGRVVSYTFNSTYPQDSQL
jgi:hypothetical protein